MKSWIHPAYCHHDGQKTKELMWRDQRILMSCDLCGMVIEEQVLKTGGAQTISEWGGDVIVKTLEAETIMQLKA